MTKPSKFTLKEIGALASVLIALSGGYTLGGANNRDVSDTTQADAVKRIERQLLIDSLRARVVDERIDTIYARSARLSIMLDTVIRSVDKISYRLEQMNRLNANLGLACNEVKNTYYARKGN